MTDLLPTLATVVASCLLCQPLGWLLIRSRHRGVALPWSWRALLGPWAYFGWLDHAHRMTPPSGRGVAR